MQACLAADRAQSLADLINRDGETIHTMAAAWFAHCNRLVARRTEARRVAPTQPFRL